MTPFDDLEARLDQTGEPADAKARAAELLAVGEAVLENWLEGRDMVSRDGTVEGFRLLSLHRQGCKGEPSFNACRETCRELVYHYNLVALEPDHPDTANRLVMMGLVARHLLLFVSGKMQVAELGEFCCSSRPLHVQSN